MARSADPRIPSHRSIFGISGFGAAARSAVRAWHVVRAPAGVLLALVLAFTGLSAMIWLLYQLGSWWVQLAAQPFPGADAGLEQLFR